MAGVDVYLREIIERMDSMRRKAGVLLFILMICGLTDAFAETPEPNVKTGWNVGALPAVAFNSDLGFEYGLILNLFDYGDGKRYPKYDHQIYLEASRWTKGSGIYRLYYDSDALLPGVRITADLSYLPDAAYDFFGFNGYESVFHPTWEDDEDPLYRTRMFYKMKRNLFRAKADFQGAFRQGSPWMWIAGAAVRQFDIGSVDVAKLNKGQSEEDKLPPVEEMPGLYERYLDWGLISAEESDGGLVPTVKAGLVYDSRDAFQNPSKGLWTEAVVIAAPEFLGAESGFMKLAVTHRQYLGLIPERLTFAYRVGYQGTILGETPFYYQPLLETTTMTGAWNEGLGGQRSLRGIRRNRVVGDGIAYANFELRAIFWRFRVKGQNIDLGVNAFTDVGRVVQKIDVNTDDVPAEYVAAEAESLHPSAGLGLKIAMNRNFVLSVEFGKALKEEDGESGLYIALNYLF